jgi:nucleotide-binding universal stress UspA family protein
VAGVWDKTAGAQGARVTSTRERPPIFHNILVAIDGSPDSDRALAHAINLAEANDARLMILSIAASLPAFAVISLGGLTLPASLVQEAEAEVEQTRRRALDLVPLGVSVSTVTSTGPARAVLASLLAGEHFDLVVLGSTRSGMRRFLRQRNLSQDIPRRSRAPILTVRADSELRSREITGTQLQPPRRVGPAVIDA